MGLGFKSRENIAAGSYHNIPVAGNGASRFPWFFKTRRDWQFGASFLAQWID